MNLLTEPVVDKELYELWSLTEDWIDDLKKKIFRASCRLGTTIEMKNDRKRVDDTWDLIRDELEPLATLFFEESNGLDHAKWEYEVAQK